MSHADRALRFAVLVIIAVAILASTVDAVRAERGDDEDDGGATDVKAAVFDDGTCGTFRDSLPVLVTRTGVQPGQLVADTTVCLTVVSDSGRHLSLRVSELVDVDVDCTGGESSVDASCGGTRRGELAVSLAQRIGVGPCSTGVPPINPSLERRLAALRDRSVMLRDSLRRGEVVCVRLKLFYEPQNSSASSASQSDRVTWRYAFSVSAGDR